MTRIEREKRVVELMIRLYCRKNHETETLCPECSELLTYAHHRLDRCKFGNTKPTCQHCLIHCYSPAMRTRIRTVMRFSGPRMEGAENEVKHSFRFSNAYNYVIFRTL